MQELIPVLIGVVIGVGVGPRPGRLAVVSAGVAALVLGTLVAWVTGELAESIGYAFVDSAVLACTVALTVAAQRVAVALKDRGTV
jgi:hypothetical protein